MKPAPLTPKQLQEIVRNAPMLVPTVQVVAVVDLAGRIARPKGSGSLLTSLTRVAAVAVKWVELEQLVERDELERELRRREESR